MRVLGVLTALLCWCPDGIGPGSCMARQHSVDLSLGCKPVLRFVCETGPALLGHEIGGLTDHRFALRRIGRRAWGHPVFYRSWGLVPVALVVPVKVCFMGARELTARIEFG